MTEHDNQTRSTQFLNKRKNMQLCMLDYIETETDGWDELKSFEKLIDQENISTNYEEILDLLFLISKIINNHHRSSDFFHKIEQILIYLGNNMTKFDLNKKTEVFFTFKDERQLLILLFRTKILILNNNGAKDEQKLLKTVLKEKDKQGIKCCYYLYPEIKLYLNKSRKKKLIGGFIEFYSQIESNIIKFDNKEFKSKLDTYEKYLKQFQEEIFIGENDSYLCQYIRNDSIDDFISHVSRYNTSLQCNIAPYKYETNPFLIEQENVSLIEYSAFNGSIQIFNYLLLNKVQLEPSLWLYAIHGKNAEIINILEENKIIPEDKSYKTCLIESIKCHHNEIANYFLNNLFNGQISDDIILCSFRYYNYSFFPTNFKLDESKTNLSLYDLITPSSVTLFGNNNYYSNQSTTEKYHKSVSVYKYQHLDKYYLDEFSSFKSLIVIGYDDYIPSYSFFECDFLTKIIIPSSITSINEHAFGDCLFLEEVILPKSLVSIGYSAFKHCRSLKQIVIPSSVTTIKNSAFSKCTLLAQITLPSSLTEISGNAFMECTSLKEIIIPSSVKSIGISAFEKCKSLTKIIIPPSVTTINRYAFCHCDSLIQISIPSSVTFIGNSAFRDCISLAELIIPSSVTSVGNYVIENCKSLKQITIPSSVIIIQNYYDNLFTNCPPSVEIFVTNSINTIKYNLPDLIDKFRKKLK